MAEWFERRTWAEPSWTVAGLVAAKAGRTVSVVLPALDEAVGVMSEPMVSHDAVAFYLLSQEVAKHVKVVQSGQGADEVFAGYHWYPPMAAAPDGDPEPVETGPVGAGWFPGVSRSSRSRNPLPGRSGSLTFW